MHYRVLHFKKANNQERLNWETIDILGQIPLCSGRGYRMINAIPDLYPLDAGITASLKL